MWNSELGEDVNSTRTVVHSWRLKGDNKENVHAKLSETYPLVSQPYPFQGMAFWDRQDIPLPHTKIIKVDHRIGQILRACNNH